MKHLTRNHIVSCAGLSPAERTAREHGAETIRRAVAVLARTVIKSRVLLAAQKCLAVRCRIVFDQIGSESFSQGHRELDHKAGLPGGAG